MRKIFLVILTLSILLACNSGSSHNELATNDTVIHDENAVTENEEPKEIELISVISDLNVRSTAGKDGVVIDKLKFGQRAIFYGEESEYKEKIIMRNIPRFSTWKKIKFSGSGGKGATEGWVYGGGLVEKEKAYTSVNDSAYTRNFKAITKDEIIELIGLEDELNGGKYYAGAVNYINGSRKGQFILNGEFEFEDWEVKEFKSEKMHDEKLMGMFINGQLEGELSKTNTGGPANYTCILTYQNDICVRASISGSYYGQEVNYETVKPSECSFKFLESTLKEE